MLSADIPPNQTIYVQNLNEKVKKEELKRSLYALFSQFGRILDIVALKTEKLRGQAWLVFSEVTAASNAVRQMQSFPFYDKPIRVQYAKMKSDCVTKADGTYVPREKKKKQEEKGGYLHKIRTSLFYLCPTEHIPQKIEVSIANLDIGDKISVRNIKVHPSPKLLSNNNTTLICMIHPTEPAAPLQTADKKRKADESHHTGCAADGPAFQNNGAHASQPTRHGKGSSSQEAIPPNNILFIQNLPYETTSMMLQILFQQYPGFKEVRMIEAKPGIAFVEFGDDMQASIAMQALQGFKITPQNPMAVTYANKVQLKDDEGCYVNIQGAVKEMLELLLGVNLPVVYPTFSLEYK